MTAFVSSSPWSRSRLLEPVRRHVARHVGAVDLVLPELEATGLPIDLLHVAPAAGRPFHALVTSGMAARPMRRPPGSAAARAELFLLLEPAWPCSRRAWRDPRWGWPARILRDLARFAHEAGAWLDRGHVVPHGGPPRPYGPGTRYCATLLAHPVSTSERFGALVRPSGLVRFHQCFPLYLEELRFALRHSSNALFARFAQLELDDVVVPERLNVGRLAKGPGSAQRALNAPTA